jgi:CRISPR-associated protein Cas5t
MKLLHIRLEGWTATFRLPLMYSGTGLSAPVPPYSTLLGLIGNVAGREIAPNETRIGYVFRSTGTAYDLETTRRLEMDKKTGRLKSQSVPGIARRQFHVRPSLELYLDNLALGDAFKSPRNAPCLGRSQDLAWVTRIEDVEAEPCKSGTVRGTLVPFPQAGASGVVLALPDYLRNNNRGYTREVGRVSKFLAVRYENPAAIERDDLCRIGNSKDDSAIYMRSLVA